MKTMTLPVEFFQLLGELESGLALAKHQAERLADQVQQALPQHAEQNSLRVHLSYLREAAQELDHTRARFHNMRYYFVPPVGKDQTPI